MDVSKDAGPAYRVNVLERSIGVMRAFTVDQPEMTLAELSRATGLHRSTVLRFLSTLAHAGFVIRNEETGRYSLGYEIIAMAEVARAGTGLTDWARPVMKAMSDRLNETVVLSVRSGDDRVDLDQIVGNQPIRRVVTLGQHKPLTFGAPSLSIMSALPRDEAEAIVERLRARTEEINPNFDYPQFWDRLELLRQRGYHEQKTAFGPGSWSGSVGIAGPLLGRRGEVIGSLGVSVPTGRMTDALRNDIIEAVVEGCGAIRARVGGRSSAA